MTRYAACFVPAAPLRKDPAHESEMVNQLLFGEVMEILEEIPGNWWRIRTLQDGYEGWISKLQVETISEKEALSADISFIYSNALINEARMAEEESLVLPFGANLRGFAKNKGQMGGISYQYSGATVKKQQDCEARAEALLYLLKSWINVPYLWGGRTGMGVDCSGFTQVVFKMMGIALKRDAAQQAMQGMVVDFLQQARCGDLAFFDNEEGKIYHVGILLDAGTIMHASGKVRIDSIDNAGIVQQPAGIRTHSLRIIRRYF